MYSQDNAELYQHKLSFKRFIGKRYKVNRPNAFNESTNKTASILKNLDF